MSTPLQQALRTYLDHLAVERGLAANSLASYRRDLRRYLAHLAARGVTEPGRIRDTSSLLTRVGALAPGTSTAPMTRSASSTARSTS